MIWIDQIDALNVNNLLTAKPSVILINVNENDYLSNENEFITDIKNWVKEFSPNSPIILFSADYETKLSDLNDTNSAELFDNSSSLPKIINEMRNCLNLISFYTCGPIEARQWTIRSI